MHPLKVAPSITEDTTAVLEYNLNSSEGAFELVDGNFTLLDPSVINLNIRLYSFQVESPADASNLTLIAVEVS